MLDYKKILKSIERRRKGIEDPHIMHAARDWFIAVLIFAGMTILGGVYLWLLHNSYYETTEFSDLDTETNVPYQAELVDRALQVVKNKKENFTAFTDNLPTIANEVFEEEIENDNELNEDFVNPPIIELGV